jgi:nitrate reductase gamma subunit
MAHQFLFGIYPYIAIAVCVVGSLIRFEREQYTWRSKSSQLLRRRQLVLGSFLFHVGLLTILAGHTVGLLTPIEVFDALGIGHGFKQGLAIVVGGLAGLACLVGLLMLLHRRLFDSRIRTNSSFWDIAILFMLLVQLLMGLCTIPLSLGAMDGHEMVKFMTWAQRIVTFRAGAADAIADVSLLFKAHITMGLTIFLVFPFTRLVHLLSVPIAYPFRRYQIVRTRRGEV